MNSFNAVLSEDVNEYSISSWLSHNLESAVDELGEEIVGAILGELDCD